MEIGEIVWAEGGGVFREFDGVDGIGGGEGSEVGGEFEFLDFPVDAAS